MPMLNAETYLPRVLEGLKRSTFQDFELLLVDDGSTDGSRKLAEAMGVIPLWSGGRRGAGPARNVGVQAARAPIVVFLDADVVLHDDALSLIAQRFAADPTLDALMGAYDEAPAAPRLVSRFRNLLHAYFHRQAETEASTFWTGLGAVRRSAFDAVGGFSATETLEDVEFGLRLKTAGHRIVLDPSIQGTHLKAWSLVSMVTTDLFRRGIPWIELALQRDGLRDDLNTDMGQRISVAATGIFLLAVAGALVAHGIDFGAPAAGAALALFLPVFSPGDGKLLPVTALLGAVISTSAAVLALSATGHEPAALAVGVEGLLVALTPLRFTPIPSSASSWLVALVLALALALSLAAMPLSPLVVLAAGAWALQLWLNRGVLALMYRRMGPLGLMGGAPLLMVYHLCCGICVPIGYLKHVRRTRTPGAPVPAQDG